jgi:hypothetical protein
MRIVTLLARHGVAKYGNALHDVRRLFEQQMPEVAHTTVVIDNALHRGHVEYLGPDTTLICGDNAAWEFSAWDRGVEYLASQLDSYDFVHLATSAFRQLYVRYLDRFDGDILGLARGRAAAIGHIDFYNEAIVLWGRTMQSWLRSSCVFLPPTELRLLGSLVSVTDRDALFSGDPQAPFRDDAPLSETYRRNILCWLTGEGTGQGTERHSRFLLSGDTLRLFEDKTAAILNEQMLAARLQAQGCAIVDATWLATFAEQAYPDGRPLRTIPNWRVQVTGRDVDAAPAQIATAAARSMATSNYT